MSETVAIEDLRVGMFIHLDGGWMSHPFPVSSFVLESQRDVERVRSLGVARLRWSREKSAMDISSAAGPDVAATRAAQAPPTPDPAFEQRQQLAAQRAAMRLCEQQHSEASSALRGIVASALAQPKEAGAQAQALAGTLVEKLQGDHDVSVLVLASHSANKASAHGLNVSVISLLLARVLGLNETELAEVSVGALMHDIGKLELPTSVHHAQDNMTLPELSSYRDHVRLGVLMGQRMGFTAGVLQVIAQHHECADGTGFPAKLVADRMSAPARVVALANRFDELCNPAQQSLALTPHEALSKLFTATSGKADAPLLNAFIRMMGVYPAGSVVQLTDDRFALVTHVNSSRPLKPRVLVHEQGQPREEALLVNLMEQPNLGIRRSLPLAQLPAAAREYLQPTPRVSYFFEAQMPPPVTAPVHAAARSWM